MTAVGHISRYLDSFAPRALAESWDNVGLLAGDPDAPAERVMTCLTITLATVAEAIERGANLIVSHHPIFFRPVQRVTAESVAGRLIWNLFRAGIAVYSAHTAFDSTRGGINDLLAVRLELSGVRPLRQAERLARVKIVVFVPEPDLERVAGAMFGAGAGVIGEYQECSFRVAGRGTFFGSELANPTVGQAGRREQVDEWRLEVVCLESDAHRVISAMRQAHSYEEPAYDVYPLKSQPAPVGAGRCGELKTETSVGHFAAVVQSLLGSSLVQVVGTPERVVRRVAVACGSGAEFIPDALHARCDALLTGEATFHRQLEAESLGIALILAGHYATERCGVEELARILTREFRGVQVWASAAERDPAWPVPRAGQS